MLFHACIFGLFSPCKGKKVSSHFFQSLLNKVMNIAEGSWYLVQYEHLSGSKSWAPVILVIDDVFTSRCGPETHRAQWEKKIIDLTISLAHHFWYWQMYFNLIKRGELYACINMYIYVWQWLGNAFILFSKLKCLVCHFNSLWKFGLH